MPDIFLSYATKDRPIVNQIKCDIEKFTNYTTWLDNDKIHAGSEWETEIDQSLQSCKIILVFVSQYSNSSKWVQRETIRGEQLNKIRIPILLNDELPLRLLDLQYVDFRGSYQGGFTELKQVIEKTIQNIVTVSTTSSSFVKKKKNHQEEETDYFLAEALRSCLKGDIKVANENLQQALISEPDLATSPEEIWNILSQMKDNFHLSSSTKKLEQCTSTDNQKATIGRRDDEALTSPTNNYRKDNDNRSSSKLVWSEMLMSHLHFVEKSTLCNYKGKDGRDIIMWSLRLEEVSEHDENKEDGGGGVLDHVDYVRYHLHKTYKNNSIQTVRDRSSHFKVRCKAWGTFEVKIQIFFVDGSMGTTTHDLTFDDIHS